MVGGVANDTFVPLASGDCKCSLLWMFCGTVVYILWICGSCFVPVNCPWRIMKKEWQLKDCLTSIEKLAYLLIIRTKTVEESPEDLVLIVKL